MSVIRTAKYMASIAEAKQEDRKERINRAFEQIKGNTIIKINQQAYQGQIGCCSKITSSVYNLYPDEMESVLRLINNVFRDQGYEIEVTQDKDNEQEFSLEISWDTVKMAEYND